MRRVGSGGGSQDDGARAAANGRIGIGGRYGHLGDLGNGEFVGEKVEVVGADRVLYVDPVIHNVGIAGPHTVNDGCGAVVLHHAGLGVQQVQDLASDDRKVGDLGLSY